MSKEELWEEHGNHFEESDFHPVALRTQGYTSQLWDVQSKLPTNEMAVVKILESVTLPDEPKPLPTQASKNRESLESAKRLSSKTSLSPLCKTQSKLASLRDMADIVTNTMSKLRKQFRRNASNSPDQNEDMFSSLFVLRKKKKYIDNEIKICELLTKTDHAYLIKVYKVIQNPKYAYIYMERMNEGTLEDYFKMMSNNGRLIDEHLVRKWTRQIADALNYIHTVLHVAHRDLKLENIMLGFQMNIKLVDFGLACNIRQVPDGLETLAVHYSKFKSTPSIEQIEDEMVRHSFCGTPHYMAPELMINDKNGQIYPYKATKLDMFSLGVCIFILLSGTFPNKLSNLYEQILLRKYSVKQVYSMISMDAFDLIHNLMNPLFISRYSARQVLNHPFTEIL